MNGNVGLRLVVLVSLVSVGCGGGVSERPGHDFAVRVLEESPITVTGQIYAPVRFAVDGCSAFDLDLEDDTGARRRLPYTPRADGTFEVSVPVSWMRYLPAVEDNACAAEAFYPSLPPIGGALVVSCRDVGRSVRAEFSMSIATATSVPHWYGYPIRAVFPSDNPLAPWAIGAWKYDGAVFLSPYRSVYPAILDWGAAELNPLVRPRLARDGDRVFVTLGCEPHAACPQSDERLADVSLADGQDAPPRGIAHVPAAVIDIAFAPDGSLVVLSQTGDLSKSSGNTSTIVTRVDPAPEGSQGLVEDEVTLLAELPRQAPIGRLTRTEAGDLMFLTLAYPTATGPVNGVLHSTDGHTVDEVMTVGALGEGWVGGAGSRGRADLSPDASSVIVNYNWDTVSLSTDPANPARDEFPRVHPDDWSHGGTVWLPGAVAFWAPSGGSWFGTVQVYDDTPPHALRWEYRVEPLPGAVAVPYLLNVTAVGDKLALTTSTGVRILGPDGTLVGGADPFPCHQTTTAVAERVGPTTVAVGAESLVYVFDVGAPGVASPTR